MWVVWYLVDLTQLPKIHVRTFALHGAFSVFQVQTLAVYCNLDLPMIESDCICSSNQPSSVLVTLSNCNSVCSGNSSQACGAEGYLQSYEVASLALSANISSSTVQFRSADQGGTGNNDVSTSVVYLTV
jgi:hypothetical protein